jgi:2,4-diketo-3-deoxy-L-fuconate hydrolase
MTHIAIAAYKKPVQPHPALALSIDGEIYDLEDVRRAGMALTGDNVPHLLAQWHDNASALAGVCEEIAHSAKRGKLQAVRGGRMSLTAPFRPERIFCAAANYIEHAKEKL